MTTISTNELRDLLARIKHAMPIAFSALTEPKHRKCPFGQIAKLVRVQAFTGIRYEDAVNRALVRAGDEATFEAGERMWGERIGPALVERDGQFYLVAKIERRGQPVYLVRKETAGKSLLMPIGAVEVARYLAAEPARPIIFRNYRLDHLTQMSLDKEHYRIRHS